MVTDLDSVFKALSDPTRRAIVKRLAEGEATVQEVAEPFQMSLPAVSKHLRMLENAGLINRRRTGREHHLSLNSQPLQNAAVWIAEYQQFWENNLDNLAALVEGDDE